MIFCLYCKTYHWWKCWIEPTRTELEGKPHTPLPLSFYEIFYYSPSSKLTYGDAAWRVCIYRRVDNSLNGCRGDSVPTLSLSPPRDSESPHDSRDTDGILARLTRPVGLLLSQLRSRSRQPAAVRAGAVISREQCSIAETWYIATPPRLDYVTAADH